MGNIEIWYSEYELRQFIDMALRYNIGTIYGTRTENQPYSVFTCYVVNSTANYHRFCSQLEGKLTKNENWRAIEIDLKDRFFFMLNEYLQWYSDNKQEFKINSNCPYTFMLSIIKSTKAEIIKYFRNNNYTAENKRPTANVNSQFSVLEWAIIFYYANTLILTFKNTKISRMKQFVAKHKIKTPIKNFKTKYHVANNRINPDSNSQNQPTAKATKFLIKKLIKITPFLKENYPKTINVISNDISLLTEESDNF